jgi:hypothetical protein
VGDVLVVAEAGCGWGSWEGMEASLRLNTVAERLDLGSHP